MPARDWFTLSRTSVRKEWYIPVAFQSFLLQTFSIGFTRLFHVGTFSNINYTIFKRRYIISVYSTYSMASSDVARQGVSFLHIF